MVENANNTRKHIANVCLHHLLGLTQSFLRRNVRHILDSHERALQPEPNDAIRGEMIANERLTAGWGYPTKETLDTLTKGDKPVLQLAALHIRHPNSKSRKRKRTPRDGLDEHLDWLPDPEVRATWPCQVSVAVRETHNSKRSIYSESRHATISQFEQTNSGPSDFEIALAEPFLIEVSKLFVAVETGSNGFRRWKRTVAVDYVLEVFVQCRDSDDAAEFLSELEEHPRARYEHISGSEGVLRAVWEKLPKCPAPGQLLRLKRTEGHKVVSPEYEMELSMGWARKRDSPLQRYNNACSHVKGQNPQLLTPSSEGAENAARHVITYIYCEGSETKIKMVEGLHCPLCRERPTSFARLLLHCATFHDHFKFDLEEPPQESNPDPAVVHKTIRLGVAPQQSYETTTTQGPEPPYTWIAPHRPFDLNAQLNGDNTWTSWPKGKAPKRRGRQPGAHAANTQTSGLARPVAKRPAPDAVADVPNRENKRHRVPDVPGVSFYHSLSKKAVNPGEMISESDESVDEGWMKSVERKALRELSINGTTQDFTLAFNQHLAREQSTSSVLMKDAVVRFTRLHHRQLLDVGWQRPFRKKLEQLQGAGVINRATVTHCIQLMQERKEDEDVEMADGASETAGTKTVDSMYEPSERITSNLPNGLHEPGRVNGQTSRTSSLEPSLRETPPTNGERKSKERVRWGTGGAVSRNPAKGISTTLSGRFNGVDVSGSRPVDGATGSTRLESKGPLDTATGGTTGSSTHDQSKPKAENCARVCVCGKSAKDARAAVMCSNPKCARKDFHLGCVGLATRAREWKCADCKGATNGT